MWHRKGKSQKQHFRKKSSTRRPQRIRLKIDAELIILRQAKSAAEKRRSPAFPALLSSSGVIITWGGELVHGSNWNFGSGFQKEEG